MHVSTYTASGPVVSTTGSTRQSRKPPWSLDHKCRYGLPVRGLMAVPLSTNPPPGDVTPVAYGVCTCACAKGPEIPTSITRLNHSLDATPAKTLIHGLRDVAKAPSVAFLMSSIVVVLPWAGSPRFFLRGPLALAGDKADLSPKLECRVEIALCQRKGLFKTTMQSSLEKGRACR